MNVAFLCLTWGFVGTTSFGIIGIRSTKQTLSRNDSVMKASPAGLVQNVSAEVACLWRAYNQKVQEENVGIFRYMNMLDVSDHDGGLRYNKKVLICRIENCICFNPDLHCPVVPPAGCAAES